MKISQYNLNSGLIMGIMRNFFMSRCKNNYNSDIESFIKNRYDWSSDVLIFCQSRKCYYETILFKIAKQLSYNCYITPPDKIQRRMVVFYN